MGQKMRAIGLRRYGPPEVLETLEVERPEPAPEGVLIRVAAAGVNPADCLLRSGALRFVARQKMPFVPGADVAGVVEAVGPGVRRFGVGDPVHAMLPSTAGGGYAEYAVASEATVAAMPPGLTFAEAAAVPLAALTALQALRDKANLAAGSRVLVNGASGGVGTFAVQISGAMGARVTAVSSGRNADLVRGLGEEFVDYTREDATAGEVRHDVVFDAVNVLAFRKARRVVRPNGVFVTVNPFIGRLSPGWLARFRDGRRIESVLVKPDGGDLETIGAWISAGDVRTVIDRSYPLAEAAEAHRYSESRRARGKIILVVDRELADARATSGPARSNRPVG